MIISKEEWNKLTCREVLELIKKYNETAPDSLKFFFHQSGILKGRLAHSEAITYLIHEEDFNSDELAVNVFKHDLTRECLMTWEEWVRTILNQDPNGPVVLSM